MKFALIALFVVVQLWTASAAPPPPPPGAPPLPPLPNFDEFLSHAKANLKSVTEHLNEMMGLPKNAEAGDFLLAVKNQTDAYTKDLRADLDKLKQQLDAAKPGEVTETVKSIQGKLEKTVEGLRKEIETPENKAKAEEIQQHFTKSLQVIVEEAGKLAKSVSGDKNLAEDLKSLSKKVIDGAVKAAESFQQSVHQSTDHKN